MSILQPSFSTLALRAAPAPWSLTYCSFEHLANEFRFSATRNPTSSQLASAADEAAQLADAAYRLGDAACLAYVERFLYAMHVKNQFAPPVKSVDAVVWSTLAGAKLDHCLQLITLDRKSSIKTFAARLEDALERVENEDHPFISDVAGDPNPVGLVRYTKNWYCSTHGFTTQLLSLTQRCNGVSTLKPIFNACLENIHDEFFITPHPQLRVRLPEHLGIRYSLEAALGDDEYLTDAFALQNFRTIVACLSDPTYALGSFYSIESVFSGVCRRMHPALQARGFPEDVIATFKIHEGTDGEHATCFMKAIEECEFDADEWANFYTGALVQLELRSKLFRALRESAQNPISRSLKVEPASLVRASSGKMPIPPSDWRLRDMTLGIAGYPAVLVAHELGLFAHLTDGPKTNGELASLLNIATRPLEALLNVSCGIGAIVHDSGSYTLSELGRAYFAPTSEFYAGGYFDLLIANYGIYSVDSVRNAVLSGKPQLYGGGDVFKTNAEQSHKAQTYTRGMHGISMAPASAWPSFVELSTHRHLLDIAGGSGAHSIGAARKWPHLTAEVFDLEPVCAVARETIERAGMCNRITTRSGDMWKDPYPRADVHLYSQIFHDWPEETCRQLAKRSFEALPNNGIIIVHEILFDDDKSGPFAAAGANIVMLLWYPDGKQYSGQEIGEILRGAGFVDIEYRRTFGYWGIVTAVKR